MVCMYVEDVDTRLRIADPDPSIRISILSVTNSTSTLPDMEYMAQLHNPKPSLSMPLLLMLYSDLRKSLGNKVKSKLTI